MPGGPPPTGDRLIGCSATISVIVVTAIAAVISYGHARQLVLPYRATRSTPRRLPPPPRPSRPGPPPPPPPGRPPPPPAAPTAPAARPPGFSGAASPGGPPPAAPGSSAPLLPPRRPRSRAAQPATVTASEPPDQ